MELNYATYGELATTGPAGVLLTISCNLLPVKKFGFDYDDCSGTTLLAPAVLLKFAAKLPVKIGCGFIAPYLWWCGCVLLPLAPFA